MRLNLAYKKSIKLSYPRVNGVQLDRWYILDLTDLRKPTYSAMPAIRAYNTLMRVITLNLNHKEYEPILGSDLLLYDVKRRYTSLKIKDYEDPEILGLDWGPEQYREKIGKTLARHKRKKLIPEDIIGTNFVKFYAKLRRVAHYELLYSDSNVATHELHKKLHYPNSVVNAALVIHTLKKYYPGDYRAARLGKKLYRKHRKRFDKVIAKYRLNYVIKNKCCPTYTSGELEAEFLARGFVRFGEFETEEKWGYICSIDFKFIYPMYFHPHATEFQVNHTVSVYKAQQRYGITGYTRIYLPGYKNT